MIWSILDLEITTPAEPHTNMMKLIQYILILLLLLSTNACNKSGEVATGVVVGGIVGGAVGAVAVAAMMTDQPIGFDEIIKDEVLKIMFKDREFIESQITDSTRIQQIVSQIKQSPSVDPVEGNFYQTVELVLTDDRIIRIGVFDSYLKNGNDYYQMGKKLNEEIKEYF